MSNRIPHAAAAALTASALYVGGWAAPFPRSFYDSFPGLNKYWVATDGPFNEHLVRDVGALYLALAVTGILALVHRDRRAFVSLGAGWTVFSVLHLGYHLGHLDTLASTADKVGEVASLSITLVLALLLLVPFDRTPKESAR